LRRQFPLISGNWENRQQHRMLRRALALLLDAAYGAIEKVTEQA
jgi:hypothetical protein